MFDIEWNNATILYWCEFINTQWSLEQIAIKPQYEDELDVYDDSLN